MICRLKFLTAICALVLLLVLFGLLISQTQHSKQEECLGGRLCSRGVVLPPKDAHQPLRHFSDISTPDSLSLPFPSVTLPTKTLLRQKWVKDLQQTLLNFESAPSAAPIFTITCNYEYRDIFLNWLIAVKIRIDHPLARVIIFSLDRELWAFLKHHNISSILVEPKSFILKAKVLSQPFYQILIIRITALRLLNYWGYDAVNIDSDAIVLKNPEPLFSDYKDSDIVASNGRFPYNLGNKWGATICGGMFLIRSSTGTEQFWNIFSQVLKEIKGPASNRSFNDQIKLNIALSAMQPDWGDTEGKSILYDEWTAMTPSGFKVTILPSKYVCRAKACDAEKVDRYYIWHKGGQRGKGSSELDNRNNKQRSVWFLRDDWRSREYSSTTGEDWLREITVERFKR